jgi:hypothetical protein
MLVLASLCCDIASSDLPQLLRHPLALAPKRKLKSPGTGTHMQLTRECAWPLLEWLNLPGRYHGITRESTRNSSCAS